MGGEYFENGVDGTLTGFREEHDGQDHQSQQGGAQAKNIFWQIAGEATFGANSHFEGVILSMTGITFQTGASFKGRALAQTAVILDGNIVVLP